LNFNDNTSNDILACGAIYIDEELEIMEKMLVFGREYIIKKKREKLGVQW